MIRSYVVWGVGENKQPDYGNVIFHSAADPSSPSKPCVVVDDPTGASVIRNGTVVNYYNPLTQTFVKDAFKDIRELQAEDNIHISISAEGVIYVAIVQPNEDYKLNYLASRNNDKGEFTPSLPVNAEVMSAGIAITDRYVITQVPKNDGTTVVRLNPRDGFGTIVESVTLPISGMERLVSLGGMYFGALMPINMASSEPLMFVTYKVIDSRNIQQVAIHTARYDEFYPNGVGGANKNGQTLDDGRIAFLYTANATADNYGVSGQTFGAFVIDPNTDTVVHQGMVPGGMVDASLNRPLDKMPVCISYGGSLVLECQHSPAELVGTFWMGINPS